MYCHRNTCNVECLELKVMEHCQGRDNIVNIQLTIEKISVNIKYAKR